LDKSEEEEKASNINTIKLNHNGQMLVAGDTTGRMRIFGKLSHIILAK
jgi:hypothetical protein